MKKVAAVVVVSLCCWLVASTGFAFCKGSRLASVTINVVKPPGGTPTISFGDKHFDPIPCVYRQGEIEITVNFTGTAASQTLILRDFFALIHALPPNAKGGSWITDFEEQNKLTINKKDIVSGTFNPVLELVFSATDNAQIIKLEGQRSPGGPRRLITYQLEMAKGTGGGNPVEVIFDPPWGERP